MIDIEKIYCISKDIVSRKIEDEFIIVPLISGIGNLDSDMYSLNQTGTILFERLDGKTTVDTIIHNLSRQFDASYDEIKTDVVELLNELVKKGIVVES